MPGVAGELVWFELAEAGGPVSSPLPLSWVSISRWTVPTAAAIAAGDPFAPNAGNAFSCLRSALSCATSSCGGSDLSVTTIWSAIAVVMHAGQS